jgi:hypothetical protein
MFVPPIPKTRGKTDVRSPKVAQPIAWRRHQALEQALTFQPTHGNANDRTMDLEAAPRFAWNFSATPLFPRDRKASSLAPTLPSVAGPELSVGDVDDPCEREADRTADTVMTGRRRGEALLAWRAPVVSKVAAPRAVTQVLREAGRPLDPAMRAFMEGPFQTDFSHIRIHADASAATATAALDARAFAAGPHIVIDPIEASVDRGRRLIAHELSHTIQQRGFASAGTIIQRQPRGGLQIALPKAEIKAVGNADVNQIVDAFPASIMNGQAFTVTITSPDGTRRTFGIEIKITPGRPHITSTFAAKTQKKPMPAGSTTPPTFAIEIFQALPDPVRTLFHEFLHLRLRIDQELPDTQRSQTFARYDQQFQMATDKALLQATGATGLKKDVMEKVAAVRNWFQTFVAGFQTPAELSATNDESFMQHFIEEKFVSQEAAAAKFSPGKKKPPVAAPLTTGTIARRYAGIVAEAFRQAAAANGLQGAVAAAETRTKASTGLPDLDGLTAQLAATLQKLFDALDAQLAQIAAFKQQPGLPQSPKQLGLREQVDEMQRTEPPLRLPP